MHKNLHVKLLKKMPGGKRGGKSTGVQKLPTTGAGSSKHKDSEHLDPDKLSEQDVDADVYDLDVDSPQAGKLLHTLEPSLI